MTSFNSDFCMTFDLYGTLLLLQFISLLLLWINLAVASQKQLWGALLKSPSMMVLKIKLAHTNLYCCPDFIVQFYNVYIYLHFCVIPWLFVSYIRAFKE